MAPTRALSRGDSRRFDEEKAAQGLATCASSPPRSWSPEVRLRRDVLSEYEGRLKKKRPTAYKDLSRRSSTPCRLPIIADRVARLFRF